MKFLNVLFLFPLLLLAEEEAAVDRGAIVLAAYALVIITFFVALLMVCVPWPLKNNFKEDMLEKKKKFRKRNS